MHIYVNRLVTSITVTLIYLSCNTLSAEGFYKWIDKNGNTHYGSSPPAGLEVKTVIVKTSAPIKKILIKNPVSIETFQAKGVTGYIMHANEKIGKYIRWPTNLTITNDVLWLPFETSILKFNLSTKRSIKYNLNKIPDSLSTQNLHISGDSFVFLQEDEELSQIFLHLYSHTASTYEKIPVGFSPTRIVRYDDKYDDGIFAFNNNKNILIQYADVKKTDKPNSEHEIQHVIGGSSSTTLSVSRDRIWYLYEKNNSCFIGFYDKNGNTFSNINNEISVPTTNKCGWIVADDEEVWVTSLSRKSDSTFHIYNINNKTWESINKSKNNIAVSQSPLQMDDEYIYYYNCEKLISINIKSRNASKITIDGFDENSKSTYCIADFKLYNGYAWILKFETYKSGRYPIFYKIPLSNISSQ